MRVCMKKIFIIGVGFTGIELAKMLILEGKSVVLVDNDSERVRHASDQLDLHGCCRQRKRS